MSKKIPPGYYGTFAEYGAWSVDISDKTISGIKLKQLIIVDRFGDILSGFLFREEQDVTDRLIHCLASLFSQGHKVSRLGGNMLRTKKLKDFLREHDVVLSCAPTDCNITMRVAELAMKQDDRRAR